MRRRRPRSENVMQGIDEWNDGFGKIFREFIEEIQQNAFNRGVKAHIGPLTNKPVPTRHYNSRKSIRQAILFAVNGACKQFEGDHDVKIPRKGSLTKRVAAQLQIAFERYEKFIIDNERKKGPVIRERVKLGGGTVVVIKPKERVSYEEGEKRVEKIVKGLIK